MTAVFVHGNPETPAIWEPLLAHVERTDVVSLQLPGFGCPAPEGFAGTKDDYADWLERQVEHLAAEHGPVDLVGHDWGGGFVMRVASRRPELLRTWASDVLGLFHPSYEWHDFAKIWQTPGAGEEYFEQTLGTPMEDRIALLESVGITRPTADALAPAMDQEMARCILALYRSAAQPAMSEWSRDLGGAAARPGLVIIASDDPFVGTTDYAREIAGQLGARIGELDGLGHWWMLGDPARGAAMLTDFWRTAA